MAEPLQRYVITPHASFQIARRRLGYLTVCLILAAPEQRYRVGPGRDVLQSIAAIDGKTHLLRVFVDVDRNPPEVVTAYRTSRVAKYWRQE